MRVGVFGTTLLAACVGVTSASLATLTSGPVEAVADQSVSETATEKPDDAGGLTTSATTTDDPMVAAAAATLASDASMPLTVAVRRIEEQRQMFLLTERLSKRLGKSWAGARIDQMHGGALVVGATNRRAALDVVRQEISAMPAASAMNLEQRVVVVRAEHSFDDTSRAANKIVRMLGGPSEAYEVVPELVTNKINVTLFEGRFGVAREVDNASRLLNDQSHLPKGFEVEVHHDPGSGYQPLWCSKKWGECDPPIRGGLQIQDAIGICTSGFLVKSKKSKATFILTAGHCAEGGKRTEEWTSPIPKDNQLHTIGDFTNWVRDSKSDAGIIRIENRDGWRANPGDTRVLIQKSDGTRKTTRDEWYDITAVSLNNRGSIPENGFLCYTGALSDTGCFKYKSIVAGTNFVQVEIPNGPGDKIGPCEGDSGGPVYAFHKGYGTIVSGTEPHEKLKTDVWYKRKMEPRCSKLGGKARYMSLSASLSQFNVKIMP